MSADPAANLSVFSPPGSGRSSPVPRAARNATEESLLKKDKGFRRYAAGVERALALWDTAQQEWADYISFLGRLLKALQTHPSDVPVIPHSDTIALRLAQCLNPTLPSGVHQKALEVYGYVFSTIGNEALARDLSIYFPGLASVLSFASLSVRPLFLSVFENHILQVDGQALRPALKAIILSLLPGLEDETSEDFERMVSALDQLRRVIEGDSGALDNSRVTTGSSHFWQCFFLATITNASRRQGALAYLVRRLPKFAVHKRSVSDASSAKNVLSPEAEAAISPEPGLLIRCFESGLSDRQLLIQRGFLDLLVSHLPLDSPVLQERVEKGDLERLVAAASGVVSRRDMSLNRRLWAWFLGPDPAPADGNGDISSPVLERGDSADPAAHHAAFFSKYGLEALTNSILKLFNSPTSVPAERARPFRVCLSLMDRWEVGGLIVPDIFLPALRNVQAFGDTASRDQFEEVLRSASAFFDGVDGGLIWGKLIHLVTSSLDHRTERINALENIKLAKFVLARFNLKEEDMILHHMPLLILSTLAALNRVYENLSDEPIHWEVVNIAFEIADSLVAIIPERSISPTSAAKKQLISISRDASFQSIQKFYEDSQGSLDATDPPFTAAEVGQLNLREAARLLSASLKDPLHSHKSDMSARILGNLALKVKQLNILDEANLMELFQSQLQSPSQSLSALAFCSSSALVTTLTALETADPSAPYIGIARLPELVHPLVACLWRYLSPAHPKFHVEATRCLLQLHAITATSRMVEGAISSIIAEQMKSRSQRDESASCARHFSILWTHVMHELNSQSEKRSAMVRRASGQALSKPLLAAGEYHVILTRPLLLHLDTLAEEGSEDATFMRSWLQDLPSLSRVFDIIAYHIQSLQLVPDALQSNDAQTVVQDDSKDCLYYMKHIFNILRRPSHLIWRTLAETASPQSDESSSSTSLQEWLVRTCLIAASLATANQPKSRKQSQVPGHIQELHHTAVSIISQVYQSPLSASLRDLEVEVLLMARLQTAGASLQSLLLGATLAALKLRNTPAQTPASEARPPTNATHRSRLSLAMNRDSVDNESPPIVPPPQLIECLQYGFTSPNSRLVLDDWVQFLIEVLPMFADTIFQNLLPLVECLCKQINLCFEDLKQTFAAISHKDISPESSLISLINGLEQILAKAHDRLTIQETKAAANKSPEQPQGFFSNVVSGVFTSEATQTRTPTANSRLTVLLCFQDTIRICFAIWSWASFSPGQRQPDPSSASSFSYTSLRMRNRARRLMEHLFAAEALECLETLIVLWTNATQESHQDTIIMGLLNVLNGSKPKYSIPAVFNAVYSRTDPSALDPNRMSTLTSDLSESELTAFLVDYIRSLEDDAMDEIWPDCALFLRDVLANPLPHRQILPTLLEFTAVIGQKVDNTTFGEQRKLRRELADIFARILTAVFTTRSMGYKQDGQQVDLSDAKASPTNGSRAQQRATDVVAILTSIVQNLPIILVDTDRVAKVVSDISTSVVAPTFRAKAFPDNVTESLLDLLQGLVNVSQTNKFLKKEISDAFNDPKFFNTSLQLIRNSWLPILAQWTQSDKERVPELLARVTAPTTAGIMFGVGAASARQEADRKTQLNLRRIALLILASPEDAYTPSVSQIVDKTVELLGATPATSPSSATRADVLILLRSVILKTSPIHLATLWPVVNGELTTSLSSLLPEARTREHYNNAGIVQSCKLLDQLVVLDPDDFQLSEWLFLSDTIDAVYKPDTAPFQLSLTDEVNEVLSQQSASTAPPIHADSSSTSKRALFLDPLIEALEKEEDASVMDMTRSELINRVVRPFLGGLALNTFESRYKGVDADWEGVWGSVVKDAVG